ncbi:MAG: IS1634 family transposase [Deltaproteobacteria bacterium]|nr:IS1634 family transposase [Deltaproteobacteria bacterium]
MTTNVFNKLTITNVKFLPIVKEYARRINLVETVNHMVGTQMELQPGPVVLAMVLDTLSGRSPLYRLIDFFEEKDTELLLGEPIVRERFTDHNVGRALDKMFEAGTQKIFSQLSQNAIGGFKINTEKVHYDTTSVSVFGDYDLVDPPFEITFGYSKAKRPDLKQFLIEMLCVERDIPLFGRTRDGNASDKTLNNELLGNISKHMARNGLSQGAFVYVADSAFVTKDNLEKAGKTNFLSRLPATYNECSRVIQDAVRQDDWINMGIIAETPATEKRPAALYKVCDSTIELYGKLYRAIVVHSSAHDKRRHKRIDRLLKKNRKKLEQACKKITAPVYFCQADALAAVKKLSQLPQTTDCYLIEASINKKAKYRPGRPKNGSPRVPESFEFQLEIRIVEDKDKLEKLRYEAGCFVLISNLNTPADRIEWSPEKLLKLYKNQSGIERNFGFLKDPVIINSVFLKKATRIEVLGMVLLIALLIWRLMEREMRRYLDSEDITITGWVRRKTKKPTAFMMSTKFVSVLVVKSGRNRQLARPLKPVQHEYLKALGVSPESFVTP